MHFRDRQSAGILLAETLKKYRDKDVVVYALPRGGVPLGVEVAKELKAPLDLVITRKIGHPLSPEYAVCAVTENGEFICDPLEEPLLDPAWLKEAKNAEQKEARRRREVYLHGTEHISAKNKVAIIVDDGIATGLTIRAAIRMLKTQEPKELIVAVPVVPYDTAEILRQEGCRVTALLEDRTYLGAVGSYYDDFGQVSDMDVIECLDDVRQTIAV